MHAKFLITMETQEVGKPDFRSNKNVKYQAHAKKQLV